MDDLIKGLFYYKTDIRFFTDKRIEMRYWIGAVLRNRFLYAAENVIAPNGMSLRSIIDTLELSQEHFLYKQFCGGFPKGFLFNCSNLPHKNSGFVLEENKVYSFSLILIGNNVKYRGLFVEAVKIMISNGFGTPIMPLNLIDISEGNIVHFSDKASVTDSVKLILEFKTPVCLMQKTNSKGNGFQNKMNNFPSFYQFMRSICYRIVTLGILYSGYTSYKCKDDMEKDINEYIEQSVEAILQEVRIKYEKRYSTPKKGENNVYTMGGYMGNLCFENVASKYIPLISFCSGLGVGSDINYGMGCFDFMILHNRQHTTRTRIDEKEKFV